MIFFSRVRDKFTVIFSIVLAVAFVLLNRILVQIADSLITFPYYYQNAFCELFTLLLASVFLIFSGMYKSAFSTKKSFLTTLKVGGFELAVVILLMISGWGENSSLELLPANRIVGFVLFLLLVGFAEELVFRGIIENALLDKYGANYKGILLSVFISGAIFGLAHMSNVSMNVPLGGVIVQVLQCMAAGAYYGAVYARTRNIWGIAFLHFLSDFAALSDSGLWGVGTIESTISDLGVFNLVSVIVYLIPTFCLLGKKNFNFDMQ